MDTGKQKSCIICGLKHPLSAFHGSNDNICLSCFNDNTDSDEGGGGFGVDIVDKLSGVKIEQEKEKVAAAENFKAVTKRLNTQIERLHQQDNPNNKNKKSNSGLFGNRGTEKPAQTTGNKTATTNSAVASNKESLFGAPPQQDSKMDNLATGFLKSILTRSPGRR